MIRNGLEPWHLFLVFAVIVLVFGGKKLPELARGMGRGLRIFRTELRAADSEASDAPSGAATATEPVGRDSAPASPSAVEPGPAVTPERPTS